MCTERAHYIVGVDEKICALGHASGDLANEVLIREANGEHFLSQQLGTICMELKNGTFNS